MTTGAERPSVIPQSFAPAELTCRWCREPVRAHAKKCAHCGEWLVETRLDQASALLRVVGWLEIGFAPLGAKPMWRAAGALGRAGAEGYGPLDPGGSAAWISRTIAAALFLYGLFIGLLIVAFAERGPRRPV